MSHAEIVVDNFSSGLWHAARARAVSLSISGKPIPDTTVFPMRHHNQTTTLAVDEVTTARKPVEVALNESRRYLKALFDNTVDAIMVINDDGRYIDANPAACAQLGYSREELVRLSVLDLTAPAFREEGWAMWKQFLARGSNSGEYSVLRKDGTVLQVEFRAVANILPGVHVSSMRDITERKRAEEAQRELAITIDVTERKYAEEGLRQSERQLGEAQRIAHIGSWSWDLNSEVQIWSDELYRIYGLQPGEVAPTYKAFLDLVHAEDRLPLGESVERAVRTREPIDLYFRIIRADGEERIIHSRGRVVYDDQGNPIRNLGTAQDVTESRRAEEALRAAEQKYRDIFENAAEGIFQTTPDGRFVSANPALVKMFGFSSPAELIRERADISNQHYVDPKCREEFKRRLDEQGVVKGFEYQGYRKDGSTIWLSENVRAVRDERGEVLYYEGTTQDITERRLANQSLRLFRTLIDQSSDAIEVIDQDTFRFLDCNESAYRTLGYNREEFLSLNVFDIDPLVDRSMIAGPDEEMDKSGFATLESIHRRKDGSTFPVEINVKVVRLERNYRLAVVRDITERKQAEAALQESEERFRQLSEAGFEAIILHDQGTILEVNQSFCRMYGYERAEVIGKSVLDLALPEFREPLRQRVRSGDTDSYEGPALRKDGTTFRAELAGKPIHYQGRTVRVAAIRDITEQKRNERRQAAQYGVTRVLAESATLAEATPQLLRVICESLRWKMGEFWRVCDSTNLLRCVETWHVPGLDATAFIEASRQTELAPGVGLPGRVWQSGQPAWIPDVMTDPRFARAAIAAKVGLRGAVAFPILLGNHTLGLMLFFSRRAPEVDEDLLKMMSAIGSQIGQFTERKRAEEALKKSEQDFRNLFEQAHDAIIVFNPEHEIVLDVNERACELYGFTRSEFIGMSLEAISKDVVRGKNEIGKTQERGVFLNFETVQYRKDGTEMFLEINASTILYQGQLVLLSINRDVTERKRADEKLQNSERYFRSIIENASDLITISDGNGIIRYESPSLERMLGYKPEERIGKSVLDLLHPHDRPAAKRHFAKGIQNPGIVHVMERRLQHKNGSWHLLETTGINLLDDPVVAGFVVNSRDITERKRAEEAWRNAERKYRDIFENAGEGIFQSTPDGRFIAANPALARMHGFASPEELIHSHPDISQQVYVDPTRREEFKRQLEEQGAVRGFEYQVFRKDGSNIWFSVNARAVRDEQSAIQYYEGTAQDITDRKRAEEALRESEERYRELFENAKDATYVHDLGGKYTSVNRAAEKLMGYARAEILGKELIHFFPPEQIEHIRECSLKLADEGETAYESELITKEGRRVAVQVESHLIFENGVPVGVQGTARDITERKAAEEKLTANSAQLRALSARLQSAREEEGTRIAREIHDELGSVLTSLKWDLEGSDKILAGPLEPSQAAALREKLQALMKLTDVAISSIRRIASELRPSVLDDLGLAAAIEWQAQQFQARTGIVCVCDCSPKTLDLSEEQSTAVFRILQEALTNVLRHAQATRVDIKLSIENGYFVLSVSDNGRGITESAEAEQQSLGILGMRERAHLIGGEIDITGMEGKGTVVIVRVPISGQDRVLKMTR